MLASKIGYWHTVRAERPTYGKRRKPVFTPRIEARRVMAKMIWRKGSFAPYRIMMLRRLWKPIGSQAQVRAR